jgi:hypothetical protein
MDIITTSITFNINKIVRRFNGPILAESEAREDADWSTAFFNVSTSDVTLATPTTQEIT